MTTLYLVRHGETVDNRAQIMQGQTPGRLNDTGRAQARELGERLREERIDAFVSSDLYRSVETCEIIARPHGKPVVTTALLRERDWGGFTGRFIPDLKDEVWPADIESMDAMRDRARRFLAWVSERYPDRTVLAVGHGIINKVIQSVYHGKPVQEIARMTNAEVRVLTL